MGKPKKTPPRAEIYSKEFEEGVTLSYKHVKDLIESAEILRNQGKHSSATVLALHAAEELGKTAMLLDEIAQKQLWITEERWNEKYCDHEHKLRRAHLAVQKNIVKITEWETTISWGGSNATKKVVPEGEQMKRYAKYDVERKLRSLYVDHGLVGGSRRWISPLASVGFDADSNIDIEFAKTCCEAIKIEAAEQGITL
jgi:AbiV family abortive infection protein